MLRTLRRFFLPALFLLLIAPAKSFAEVPPSVTLNWYDIKGNIYQKITPERVYWVWSKATPTSSESPALRIEFQSRAPIGWTPTLNAVEGMIVVQGLPVLPGTAAPQPMAIELRALNGKALYTVVDPQERQTKLTLVAQVFATKPYIIASSECEQLDVGVIPQEYKAPHLYVGLKCIDRLDRVELFFFKSEDAKWFISPGLIRFVDQEKYPSFRFVFEKAKSLPVPERSLFATGTLDHQGMPNTFSVIYAPRWSPPRLYGSLALAPTYYAYKETIDDIEASQLDMTLRTNFGYRLLPKHLFLTSTGFFSLFRMYRFSGSENATARWYGVNMHLGYRVPFLSDDFTEYYVLGGWYAWGMMVNAASTADDFGIQSLNGPQFILMMQHSRPGKRGFGAYFKFALIGDRFRMEFPNREITLGGGYELSKENPKPWALLINMSHIQFSKTSDGITNGMSLWSFSLGLQKTVF